MADLPDINVWVALVFDGHVHHRAAAAWFESAAEGSAAFCRVTQMGLLRLITSRKVMGEAVQSQRQAWAVYDALASDERVTWLAEPRGLEARWRRYAASTLSATESWTDAYLAAFAAAHGLRLVTFDQGFRVFKDVEHHLLPGV